MVQLAAHRAEAGLDVAQALAIGELGEGHRQILIPAVRSSLRSVPRDNELRTSEIPCGADARSVAQTRCVPNSSGIVAAPAAVAGGPAFQATHPLSQTRSFAFDP